MCLAVVGSRRATRYAEQAVQELVEPIARAGVVIVSGLAFGVDALAHRAALNVGGITVAVLGGGVDERSIAPVSNRALAESILDRGGAILSEYPDGTESVHYHFPVRNRIIAGMSQGTLVVEAAVKSGSLITSKSAMEEGRDVFAVPGPITSELSQGPNNLLKMGARPVTSAEDILSVFGVLNGRVKSVPVANSPTEAILLELLSREPAHVDDLVRKSGLPTPTVTSTLTLMEMNGSARHLGGMFYVRG